MAARSDTTVVTRAFSGGNPGARLRNAFIDLAEQTPPPSCRFRRQERSDAAGARRGRKAGQADYLSLWAGRSVVRRGRCPQPGSENASRGNRPQRQHDRRAVRRAVGGVVPGIAIAMQRVRAGDAFFGDEALQRLEPVPVIGFAGVGRRPAWARFDLGGTARRPFGPGEQSALVQGERHRESLRLPRLANTGPSRRAARRAPKPPRASRREDRAPFRLLQIGLPGIDRTVEGQIASRAEQFRADEAPRCRAIAGSLPMPITCRVGENMEPITHTMMPTLSATGRAAAAYGSAG